MSLSVISKKIRQYPLLVVSSIIIVLCGVLLFMRGPKTKFYEEEIIRLEREWGFIQTNLGRSMGLESDIDDLQNGLQQIQSRLMNPDEVAANYEFFFGLEERSGLEFEGFSQGAVNDGSSLKISKDKLSHFQVLPYNISLSGTISQILTFMDLLDHQEFIVRLELINIMVPAANFETITDETQLAAVLRCSVLASTDE